MAKLSAETRYCLASEPTPAAGHRPAEPRLLRQRLGRPLRDDGAGRARSAAARGDDRQRRPLAAAVASRAESRSSRWPRPRPACRWASIATSTTPIALLPLAPGDSLVLYTDGITEAMNAAGRALRLAAAADAVGLRRRSRQPVGPPHPRRREALRRRPLAERRHVSDVFWEGEGGVAGLFTGGEAMMAQQNDGRSVAMERGSCQGNEGMTSQELIAYFSQAEQRLAEKTGGGN